MILLAKKDKSKRKFIFRPYFTRNGIKYYAKDYGKKAFKIYLD
nr:MAG TPA: hypothetical protein [Caudoviricetes sp.]